MKIDKLLEYLDLEAGNEFEYFENLADLVEADFEIPSETLFALFSDVDMETLAELLRNYFEEILESIPQDATELYTLLDTVKLAFVGIASNMEEDRDLILLADEFSRFRNWYSLDSDIHVSSQDNKTPSEQHLSIRDALTLARLEKLDGGKFDYDFDGALDFEIDRYAMSFADLVADDLSELQEDEEEAYN